MPSKTKPKSSRKDINAEITQKFIDAIEAGVSPFKVPWSSSYGMPRNFVGREYRGINFFLTLLHCDEFGWDIPVFMTFKQAKEQGFKIRKGEKSVPVTFSSVRVPMEYRDDPDACPSEKRFFYSRFYRVFNVAQVEGIDLSQFKESNSDVQPDDRAQSIVESYVGGPEIRHEGVRAFYRPETDVVTMPGMERFHTHAGYYEVLYHELAHSSGHSTRLDRPIQNKKNSPEYAFEELVAELASSFLCAHAGLLDTTFENSASYLDGWLDAFKKDTGYLMKAAGKAQKAVDFILGASSKS